MSASCTGKIAIVIPAYKPDFLRQTLASIASQTCRDFVVYVGDDCSEHDIKSAVDSFSSAMQIRYCRFDHNLGGEDLVAQWERCIRLAEDEKWIWLFSDDDIMPVDGVERLKLAIAANPSAGFFRFGMQIVDKNGGVMFEADPFHSGSTSAEEWLREYFCGARRSSACEYVFDRSLFDRFGMVHFPCAWCADIATWYMYAAKSSGMVNICGAPVSWRNAEGVNISSTRGMYAQKMDALIQFVSWMTKNHPLPFGKAMKRAFREYVRTVLFVSIDCNFSLRDLVRLLREFSSVSLTASVRLFAKYVSESVMRKKI